MKKRTTARLFSAILLALGIISASSLVLPVDTPLTQSVYADPVSDDEPEEPTENPADTEPGDENEDENNSDESEEGEEEASDATKNACQEQVGSLSWIVCPTSSVVSNATGAIYTAIEDMLKVNPISMGKNSPIYLIWQYLRSLTNIIFIICLLIVIYSQLTGMGIQNYGIKRILPRLVVSVILVNLSFIICALAVDVSNVVGESLRGTFAGIGDQVLANAEVGEAVSNFHLSEVIATLISGGAIAGVAISAFGGGRYLFYMLLIVLFGALVAVISGLITIAARQALVALLIMVSPLAFVAYLFPNTERWFSKWKDLLFRMLIFYPMFSFLFGASQLIGYTLILAAEKPFGILLGIAVQIFPLFFSWSLMKMSGTILNTINQGARKVLAPVQKGLTGWGASHAEQNRQHHIANSTMPGAKLRRYLDYRQKLRELDTTNSSDLRTNRALEATYRTASSNRGYDSEGNMRWDPVANRYTQNAKAASLYQTRASTAESSYKNTLTAYGRIFSASGVATRLSNAHGEAYKDNMAQQFLTANEAQSDQEYLLGQYLSAQNNHSKHPYEFNRLIKGAAGSLGHTGESSIMGQVIIGNSTIESRRRTEARIMITKFGYSKSDFRGMTFDTDKINDNGIETDAYGKEIQDDQYRMLPGHKHTPWQSYIGRHSVTGEEISKEAYDALDPVERHQYRKVKYFHIKDDAGNVVQTVYDDDAGYMKELLNDDIAIGDPINRRYLTEIGVAHAEGEKTGILRKYHSTIANAMLSSNFKVHDATITPMVTSQTNNGFVTSPGQLIIGQLQSLNVAMKPGNFLQNDGINIKQWDKIIQATYDQTDPDALSYYITDQQFFNYRNVNGEELKGLRLADIKDSEGNVIGQKWEEVGNDELDQMTYDEVVDYRKNYFKHKIVPKAIKQLIGTMNRELSPAIQDAQKPATLKALKDLVSTLMKINAVNNDTSRSFEERPDGGENLMSKANKSALTRMFDELSVALERKTGSPSAGSYDSGDMGYDTGYDGDYDDYDDSNYSDQSSTGASNSSSNNTNSGQGSSRSGRQGSNNTGNKNSKHPGVDRIKKPLKRKQEEQYQYDQRNNIIEVLTIINDIFAIPEQSLGSLENNVISYLSSIEKLNDELTINECKMVFYNCREKLKGTSTQDRINNTAKYHLERKVKDHLYSQIVSIITRMFYI